MGRPAGRPPKFSSPDELQKLFDEWQASFTPDNDEIPDVEGLCVFLDTSRQTLFEYESRDGFTDAIKRIKDWILFKKKQLAMKGKIPPAIYIFDAKNNAGYVDKTEQDVNHSGVNVSDKQLDQIIKARTRRSNT